MIIEDNLTLEQKSAIHKFGYCWIEDYDKYISNMWRKALNAWAWEKKIVWSKNPSGYLSNK